MAVFYFGFEILLGLAPEAKAALLLLGFGALVALSGYATELKTTGYALAAGVYVLFLFYVIATFGFGSGGIFAALALSAGLFVALGWLEGGGRLALSLRTAVTVTLVFAAVGGVIVVADALGEQPSYETETLDHLSVDEIESAQGPIQIGQLTATNDHYLSRTATIPRYTVCIYDGDSGVEEESVAVRDGTERLWNDRQQLSAGEQRTYALTLSTWAFYGDDGVSERFQGVDEIPIEVADSCPDDVDEPRIVIRPGSPNWYYSW